MARLAASILGGVFAAIGIFALVVISVAWLATASLSDTIVTINRANKGDRAQAPVGATENLGSVVWNDPARQTTTAAKDSARRISFQERRQPAVHRKAIEKPASDNRRRLEGCDPLVSPLAAPSLAHIAGRCLASAAPGHTAA